MTTTERHLTTDSGTENRPAGLWKTCAVTVAAFVGLLARGAEPVADETESLWDRYLKISADVGVYSSYICRGMVLVPNPVWQPSASLFLNVGEHAEYGFFKLNAWAVFMIEPNRPPRQFAGLWFPDETVSYNVTFFDSLDIELGHVFYQYPTRHADGLRDTDEILLSIRYRNPILTPSLRTFWDYGPNGHTSSDFFYFDFNVAHPFRPVDRLTLSPGTGVAFATGHYMSYYSKAEVTHAAFTHMHLDLTADYALTDWMSVGAKGSYYWYPSRHVRESHYVRFDRYEDGILYGGVYVKFTF